MSRLFEVAFYVPDSSGETGDVLSEIEHKFAEMCSTEGWILDGVGISDKPRGQGQKAPVEREEQTLDLTQLSSSWNKIKPTSVTLLEKTGPMTKQPAVRQAKENNCEQSVQRPHIAFVYTEMENCQLPSLITEISEKLKISEARLRAIEEVLVCSICRQVVQRPHTLVCGHSFCTHCIREWKKKQKCNRRKLFCPDCFIYFPSTRLILENARGAKSKLQYPKNWMLGNVSQVFIHDEVSTNKEQRFEVLEREAQTDSSSSGVEDNNDNFHDEMEQTGSIQDVLCTLLVSMVLICIFMFICHWADIKMQGPGTSPGRKFKAQ